MRRPTVSQLTFQQYWILSSFEGLRIALQPVSWQQMLPLAVRFDRSAYDAAYLALAEGSEQPLITGDSRLYHAVREHLDWVQWIGDYGRTESTESTKAVAE